MSTNVLVLETSTESGSIAIVRDDVLVAELLFASRDSATGARTEALGPAVTRCLDLASISARDLTAVVCGAGPGGFTSLRSAAALAKGICTAWATPLYAVSSLELLAWSAGLAEGSFIVALPAGRNESFALDVTCEPDHIAVTSVPYLIRDDELRTRALHARSVLVGPRLDIDAIPRAASTVSHLNEIRDRGSADLDAWEPSYGRLAEAQVKWETAHGRPLSA
ncbi:MAG: tRNA (adenosine(37)-N6)-threonylcarbamoyltransferase complex dimerization subunit type 1 TsaB [Gemmatimonadaceae bacterium]